MKKKSEKFSPPKKICFQGGSFFKSCPPLSFFYSPDEKGEIGNSQKKKFFFCKGQPLNLKSKNFLGKRALQKIKKKKIGALRLTFPGANKTQNFPPRGVICRFFWEKQKQKPPPKKQKNFWKNKWGPGPFFKIFKGKKKMEKFPPFLKRKTC